MTVHFQRPAAQQHYDLRMTPVPVTEHGYPGLNYRPQIGRAGVHGILVCELRQYPFMDTMCDRRYRYHRYDTGKL